MSRVRGPLILRQERERVPAIHDFAAAAEAGDGTAAAELFAALYGELRTQAENLLRNSGEQVTLGTTTLLHESYIKLADREGLRFPDRARSMAYAAKALRGLMIDDIRARRARKRGGEFQIVRSGDEEFAAPDSVPDDQRLERLAHALADPEKLDPRLAAVVDFHFFGGFSFTGIASLGERTPRTVQRDWRKARLLLQRLLTEE